MRAKDGNLGFSPSDLNSFLACPHLTSLELRVAGGLMPKPFRVRPAWRPHPAEGRGARAAVPRGAARRGSRRLRRRATGLGRAARETEEALRAGGEVVYQAAFVDGDWRGFADFVERQPDGSYEVVDTKLARHARPAHVLQLCFYTEQVGADPGRRAARMHVVNGLGERESFRPGDYVAYYRRVRERFLDAIAAAVDTYPYPVEHCSLCDFLERCEERWAADDHLVARSRASCATQVERLGAAEITTLDAARAGARRPAVAGIRGDVREAPRPGRAPAPPSARPARHRRAPAAEEERGFRCCRRRRRRRLLRHRGRSLLRAARGLEYLYGWSTCEDGELAYRAFWARDRAEEKRAFEESSTRSSSVAARTPGMHVYHYAHYERTALQRLMGEHGTREDEVDDLLRGEVLVDLFRVVRQALRISRRATR